MLKARVQMPIMQNRTSDSRGNNDYQSRYTAADMHAVTVAAHNSSERDALTADNAMEWNALTAHNAIHTAVCVVAYTAVIGFLHYNPPNYTIQKRRMMFLDGYNRHAYLGIYIIVGRYSLIGRDEYWKTLFQTQSILRFQCKNRKVYYTATSLMFTKKKKKF